MPKSTSATARTITFRLSEADREWLEATAQANGCEVAQLLRWALEAYRQYVEMHEGHIHLPIDIRKLWTAIEATNPRPGNPTELVLAAEKPPPASYRKSRGPKPA